MIVAKNEATEEARMMIVAAYLSPKIDGSMTRECYLNFTV